MDSFIQTRLGQEMALAIIHFTHRMTKKREQISVYCRDYEAHEQIKTYILAGYRFVAVYTADSYATIVFEKGE